MILIAAILVHVSGQVAILLHLSGHKRSESAGLNLIAAILVHVSGRVAILLHLTGHKTSDMHPRTEFDIRHLGLCVRSSSHLTSFNWS